MSYSFMLILYFVNYKRLFPLRLRVALRGERYRNTISVSTVYLSPRNATSSRNGSRP